MILRVILLLAFIFCQVTLGHYRYRKHGSVRRCHQRCYANPSMGRCLPSGRCLCRWGWTGPNSVYSARHFNRIKADYCEIPCTYTAHYRNFACIHSSSSKPSKPIPEPQPTGTCSPKCEVGYRGLYGTCLSNGRCLCRWGCTGPNAAFVQQGSLRNRIVADNCLVSCKYSYYYPNPLCTQIANPEPTTTTTTTPPPTTTKGPCDARCKWTGQCLHNGRCLCKLKYTGPNSKFIARGYFKNRIVADYCTVKCFYNYSHGNKNCIHGQTVKTTPAKPTCKSIIILILSLYYYD